MGVVHHNRRRHTYRISRHILWTRIIQIRHVPHRNCAGRATTSAALCVTSNMGFPLTEGQTNKKKHGKQTKKSGSATSVSKITGLWYQRGTTDPVARGKNQTTSNAFLESSDIFSTPLFNQRITPPHISRCACPPSCLSLLPYLNQTP